MKSGFVQNSNYARFLQAVKAVEQRGSKESGILLVSGEPGLGKSRAVDRWAADNNALYLRATEGMRHGFLLNALAAVLGVDFNNELDGRGKSVKAPRNNAELQARLTGLIGRHQKAIVIDEAQKLLGQSATLLEVLRDISDLTEVTVVLVAGVADFGRQIKKHTQISSRIFKEIPFEPWTVQDVQLACKQLSEVEIEDALAAKLTADSKGVMRLVMNGISTLERLSTANGMKKALLEDFSSIELCADWTARKPRLGATR
jgi:DNA transposition AAA+ family ATPase